jgi:single-strand DNA-binding protein
MEMLIIAGTVGKDAELRRTQSGDPILSFSLAVDQGKDRNGQKRDTKWYDASIFGKRAESLQSYITKGSKLTLQGRPTAREYNGKVYMGIAVNDLTFMGGGQQREDTGQAYGGGSAYGASTGGAGVVDDEIPFAAEVRA